MSTSEPTEPVESEESAEPARPWVWSVPLWIIYWALIIRKASWIHLRSLGNSRLVTTSFAWLALVPLAARTIDWINGISSKPAASSQPASGHWLSLPGNLAWLFWMSAAFAIGQLIYWRYCPRMIREVNSFGGYRRDHGEAIAPLCMYVGEIVHGLPPKKRRLFLNAIADALNVGAAIKGRVETILEARVFPDLAIHFIQNRFRDRAKAEDGQAISEGFVVLLRGASRGRRVAFYSCGAAFVTGGLIFAGLAIYNAYFVFKTSWLA